MAYVTPTPVALTFTLGVGGLDGTHEGRRHRPSWGPGRDPTTLPSTVMIPDPEGTVSTSYDSVSGPRSD